MKEDFSDFNDRKVRERLSMKYHAGSADYPFIEEHCEEDAKSVSFLNGNNASLGALVELLDSCLSGPDDSGGAR